MKIGRISIVLCLIALLLVSCGNKQPMHTEKPMATGSQTASEGRQESESAPMSTENNAQTLGDLLEIVVKRIYEEVPIALDMMAPRALDLENAEAVKLHLGLDSAEGIECVTVSEPIANVQPFTLALVRVADGGDTKSIKTAIANGFDKNRWVETPADEVGVINSGKLILLVASQDSIADVEAVCDAFVSIFGEENCGTRILR